MATPIAGHPLAVIPSQPKPKKFELANKLGTFIDRTIGIFSPDAGKRRMHSRMWLNKFSYEGARPGTWRSQATLNGNASPETTSLNYDRIRLIWEARDLEQNFPFVKRMLSMFCDYVLGDFRIKSKATSEADRKAIDDYWDLCCQYSDPTGRLSFQDQCHLALRSQVRDGDMIGQKILESFTVPTPTGDKEMQFYQLRLIEADRIGYPYEGSIGNGYINGTIFDPATGYIQGYRIFQRDYLSNTYSNPQDIPSSECLYIGKHQRADSLRCVTEFAPCIPTARDIQEIIENERLAVKWCSSQAGVVTRLTGDASFDNDIFPDYFQAQAQGGPAGSKLTGAMPGAIQYLAPGEDWKAFEYNRASPAFIGLLQTLYRDCCLSVEVPFGFAYEPTTNGIASRLESAQARRTFTSRQRLMRDKLIMPFRNQCLIHGLNSGQLKLSPQGEAELLDAKIIWPAHPTVDVGRESTANVSEYNANLKAGETIAEERGDDYDEMVGQIEYEDRKKRQTLGLAQSVVNNFGPRGIDGLFQIYTQVSSGAIPPENARQMLKTLFGLNDEEANDAIPANFKVAPPPMPAPGVGKNPAKPQPQQSGSGFGTNKFSGPEDEPRDNRGRWESDGGMTGEEAGEKHGIKPDSKLTINKATKALKETGHDLLWNHEKTEWTAENGMVYAVKSPSGKVIQRSPKQIHEYLTGKRNALGMIDSPELVAELQKKVEELNKFSGPEDEARDKNGEWTNGSDDEDEGRSEKEGDIEGKYVPSENGGGTWIKDGEKYPVDEDGRFEVDGKEYYVNEDEKTASVPKDQIESAKAYGKDISIHQNAGIQAAKEEMQKATPEERKDYDKILDRIDQANKSAREAIFQSIKQSPDENLKRIIDGADQKLPKSRVGMEKKATEIVHQIVKNSADQWVKG